MRSLKFKKKPSYTTNNTMRPKDSNNNKEDEEEGEEPDEAEVKEEKIDYATWRRRNGVKRDQKVFIIKSGY